jgi:hypothetical protein
MELEKVLINIRTSLKDLKLENTYKNILGNIKITFY